MNWDNCSSCQAQSRKLIWNSDTGKGVALARLVKAVRTFRLQSLPDGPSWDLTQPLSQPAAWESRETHAIQLAVQQGGNGWRDGKTIPVSHLKMSEVKQVHSCRRGSLNDAGNWEMGQALIG